MSINFARNNTMNRQLITTIALIAGLGFAGTAFAQARHDEKPHGAMNAGSAPRARHTAEGRRNAHPPQGWDDVSRQRRWQASQDEGRRGHGGKGWHALHDEERCRLAADHRERDHASKPSVS